MRILWASNYLSQSGYAIQARLFVPRLVAMGHQVFVLPLASRHIEIVNQIDGVPILNLWDDPLGNDGAAHYWAKRVGADVILSFTDTWALDPEAYGKSDALWCPITPIETEGITNGMARVLDQCAFPLAISQFGLEQLKTRYPDVRLWPLAYDPGIWKPGDKAQARRDLGFPPDHFIAIFVGLNDTLPSRKSIPELLTAWKRFSDDKDNVLLYLHTALTGYIGTRGLGNGVNISKLFQELKLSPTVVKIADEAEYRSGVATEKIVQMSQAADVLIAPSRREGFCLPVIEFQASGCPVIVSNAHAQRELVGNPHRRVDGQQEWGLGGNFEFAPNVDSLVHALDYVQINPGFSMAENEQYEIDRVMDQHIPPIMEAIADTLLGLENNG